MEQAPQANNIESLRAKYDARYHAGVRGVRKSMMLEIDPDIVDKKGSSWIDYLYTTAVPGELNRYRLQLEAKLEGFESMPVMKESAETIFNPEKGEFKGFISHEEKQTSIQYVQDEIAEIGQVIASYPNSSDV